MNDKTLLELAAKAQGWFDYPDDSVEAGSVWHTDKAKAPFDPCIPKSSWNPLTDDGDALRLAVKLGMDIGHVAGQVYANDVFLFYCDYNDDPCLATRRAIVTAAAATAEQGEKE